MKRLFSIILTLCMAISMMPSVCLTVNADDSGTCGDNLTWTLDSDGVLTISGTGPLERNTWGYNESKITSIVVNDGITSIVGSVLAGHDYVTHISIPDSVTSIGESAFAYSTSLESIIIPDSVTVLGKGAFSDCTSLKEVTLSKSLKTIEDYTFDSCESLTTVTIPDGVTTILQAFSDCTSLTSVVIPNSVTYIDSVAFLRCDNLTDIYYTGSEEEWNNIEITYPNIFYGKGQTLHYNYVSVEPTPTPIPATAAPEVVIETLNNNLTAADVATKSFVVFAKILNVDLSLVNEYGIKVVKGTSVDEDVAKVGETFEALGNLNGIFAIKLINGGNPEEDNDYVDYFDADAIGFIPYMKIGDVYFYGGFESLK